MPALSHSISIHRPVIRITGRIQDARRMPRLVLTPDRVLLASLRRIRRTTDGCTLTRQFTS
jgi:hypothetical protein